jgi:cytochrome c oxidase subunit 3
VNASVHSVDPKAWRGDTATLAMWVFLATEVMFFGALFLGYLHMRMGDPQGIAAASRHTHEWLGTINTAILLTSSFTMVLAVRAARLAEREEARRFLWITAALGLSFMAVKGLEYTMEWNEGLVPGLHFTVTEHVHATALFFYLYFVATGIHALHLAIGVATVSWLAWRLRAPAPPDWRVDEIDALGLYWHFVDAIWIVLYPLFYLVDLHG